MPLTHKRTTINLSRSLKQILKAIGGATVCGAATFSLFSTSAQAASFVTEFFTPAPDPWRLEWSGEDANKDGEIDGTELSGPVTLSYGLSVLSSIDLGDPSVDGWDYNQFSFDLDTSTVGPLDLGTDGLNFTFQLGTVYFESSDGAFSAGSFFNVTTQAQAGTEHGMASTPEPSLTLGFITLGGLMLGTRKKVKA